MCPWEFAGGPVPGAFTTMAWVQSLVKELRPLELRGSARNTQDETQQQQKCLPLLEAFANLLPYAITSTEWSGQTGHALLSWSSLMEPLAGHAQNFNS